MRFGLSIVNTIDASSDCNLLVKTVERVVSRWLTRTRMSSVVAGTVWNQMEVEAAVKPKADQTRDIQRF